MDSRDRQGQIGSGGSQRGWTPQPGRAGQSSAGGSANTSALTPFIPQFRWAAGRSDFPIGLATGAAGSLAAEQSTIASILIPRSATADPGSASWGGDDVYIPAGLRKYAPLALILLAAVIVLAAWQLLGDGDDPDEDGVIGQGTSTAETSPTSGSVLGVGTQSPGDGGAAATVTPGGPAPSTPGAGTGIGDDGTTPDTGTDDGEPDDGDTDGTGTGPDSGDGDGDGDGDDPVIIDPADLGVISVDSQEGESLADVATRWGLEVSTLVWANGSISDPLTPLEPGTAVVVPPVNGVVYIVQDGDTLASITSMYGLDPSAITSVIQNRVQSDADLEPGMTIAIYGAKPLSRDAVAVYTVRDGDSIDKIAALYGLKPSTVAVANDLPDDLTIFSGQQLVIPPADGVLVYAGEGDTVELIAQIYSVTPEAIRAVPFNALPGDTQPVAGQQILVPGEDLLTEPQGKGGSDEEPATDPFAQTPAEVGVATGTFMWPTQGNLTQDFHSTHNGLDLANTEFSPIVASDGGTVIFAGWNDNGLGYAVGIDHGNGYQTWYGHMADVPAVSVGQLVAQGEWLGPMGTTGKSTGPHLHFLIMLDDVYQDPLSLLP